MDVFEARKVFLTVERSFRDGSAKTIFCLNGNFCHTTAGQTGCGERARGTARRTVPTHSAGDSPGRYCGGSGAGDVLDSAWGTSFTVTLPRTTPSEVVLL